MSPHTASLVVLLGVALAGAIVILLYPGITREQGGRVLAFFPLALLPVTAGAICGLEHLERSKRLEFCLSCHEMKEHGRSLYIDGPNLPASHFQNQRVPRETACYACHTDYSMYGDIRAKWRGLKHVYVHFFGAPAPSEIKLYAAYNNQECLYCHADARSFKENAIHRLEPSMMQSMKANQLSCISCHDMNHDIETLGKATLWDPTAP